jgi:ribosomal protein S18 acetylase RimI-like enzyme
MGVIRQARLGDARAIGRIEVDTWRSTYAGMLPDRVLLAMSQERRIASWAGVLRHRPGDVYVAIDQGRGIAGFGDCGPQRDGTFAFAGEVYTLYVSPDAQGRGFGRQLLIALFARLVDCGHRSALVWVVRANPARFFYERLGGKLVLHRPIPVSGTPVEAIAYGWKDLRAVIDRQARSGAGGSSPG